MHRQSAIATGATFQGRYEVHAEIGSGGFGTIYKAKQLATGQFVAIKVLRWQDPQGTSSDRKLARFLREMRLCARLHHPNIVRLIDSGRTEGDALYTVFEFVPGQNLADVLAQEGVIHPVEARHLMLQVLDALACAHAKGIVHRDLKPNNIMVTTGARRNALILDFGISAITGAAEYDREDLTVTGEMLGSPKYAAPEQFLQVPPTPRSDLFSWALVFLECLVGSPPTVREQMQGLVLRRLDPEPISLPPSLSNHPLGAVLRRALVKDVSARVVSAEALLHELEACDVRDLRRPEPTRRAADSSATRPYPREANAPWEASAADRSSPPMASSAPRPKRPTVTALCCQVEMHPGMVPRAGFDGMLAALPQLGQQLEDTDAQLDLAQHLMSDIARRRGGGTVSASSDAVVVCFGHLVAHDDDAARAVRTALAIGAAMRELRGPASEGSATADVAIGIHTGPVAARDPDDPLASLGPVVGMTLRSAIEIARCAMPGEILVSAETRQLTAELFDYRPEEALNIHSGATKVDVFSLQTAPRVDPAGRVSARHAPLVGRKQELARVFALSEGARRGEGRSILIVGEAGIGKSRLAHEVVRRLGVDGFTVLRGRCTPETIHRALHLFIDLVGGMLQLGHHGARPVRIIRGLEALVRSHGFEANDAVPLFATLLGVSIRAPYRLLDITPSKLKEMTREALVSLVVRMAEARPLVLVLEDIHWSDPTTHELLRRLSAKASTIPLLVLMSARNELALPWSEESSVERLPLGRLARSEAQELILELTQGMTLHTSVVDHIVDRSGGVPLLVEEIALALVGCGELVERDGCFKFARSPSDPQNADDRDAGGADLPAEGVPKTLHDAVAARLDGLGRAKDTAEAAAVVGVEFRVDVLVALASLAEFEVRQDLHVLTGADIVRGGRSLAESTCSFKHALVHEAVYDRMLETSRRQMHARLARVLEVQFAELAETRPELLVQHHAAANQMAPAIAYAQRAAARALQRGANDEAIAYVQGALSWVDAIANTKQRHAVELELNNLLTKVWRAEHTPSAEQCLTHATGVAGRVPDAGQTKASGLGDLHRPRRRRGPRR